MARKNYSDEFKGDAVALYRDTDGTTITAIGGDLGVSGSQVGDSRLMGGLVSDG